MPGVMYKRNPGVGAGVESGGVEGYLKTGQLEVAAGMMGNLLRFGGLIP